MAKKKLLDGIGFGQHKLERVEEDTLKLMECSHHCLKAEMDNLLLASWDTFTLRQILSIQCVSDKITLLSTKCSSAGKWCLIEVRSAVVPRDWQRRNSWVHVFDLLQASGVASGVTEVTRLLERDFGSDVLGFEATIHAYSKGNRELQEPEDYARLPV
ncbi:hypothetical protein O0I10_004478 [Lichtheimia ornata]|uniref:Uncharacterized protein n=1 Tax=Lichtheimia ornata TaxID=688661 RepID=A0AAD7XZ97_9FUNG|nr:uncharacterized protein O0I10_004478 [Lichtheimia ornata]KAJ8659885.1 hypothetical protein O0I10_004478 [Lichtheimia ornata]